MESLVRWWVAGIWYVLDRQTYGWPSICALTFHRLSLLGFVLIFWDWVSLHSPGWPGTHCVRSACLFLPDAGMWVCTPPSHSCPLLSWSPWWAAAAFLLAQACLFIWLPLPRQCPKAASCVRNLKDLPCQLTDKQPNTMPQAHIHRGITYSDWENGGHRSANRWIK